jgi:hypothetical protein
MTVLRPRVSNVSTRRQSLPLTSGRLAESVCITTLREVRLDSIKHCEAHTKGVEIKLQWKANEYRQ